MLPRILEPEVMDTALDAADYDAMDHAEVNRRFVADFLAFAKESTLKSQPQILDVGTGTALIPIELCRNHSECKITAVDLSREMLKLGDRNVVAAGFQDRIHLEWIDAKELPFDNGAFDAVVSNSIIHHIPEPDGALAEMKRVLTVGGVLFVRDLLRPQDIGTLHQLVETYAGNENAHSQQMFRDSLHAALTLEEVRELLTRHDLPEDWVCQTSDRHWTIAGRL
jgi:ubiquinone/menaquinone biosynthesis C-methylase UbiE